MRIGVLVAVLVILFSSAGSVFAVDNPTFISQQQTVAPVPAPDVWKKDCPVVRDNLQDKILMFETQRDAHLEKYSVVRETFERIVVTLDEAGFDAERIEKLLPKLDERITNFKTTAARFVQQLQASDELACNEYVLFKTTLDDSRAGLRGTRLASSDIKRYATDVLIPEVRAVLEAGN